MALCDLHRAGVMGAATRSCGAMNYWRRSAGQRRARPPRATDQRLLSSGILSAVARLQRSPHSSTLSATTDIPAGPQPTPIHGFPPAWLQSWLHCGAAPAFARLATPGALPPGIAVVAEDILVERVLERRLPWIFSTVARIASRLSGYAWTSVLTIDTALRWAGSASATTMVGTLMTYQGDLSRHRCANVSLNTDRRCRPVDTCFVITRGSRRMVHVGVTRHPTDQWIAQQQREATPFDARPQFLIDDNDAKYGPRFDHLAAASGTECCARPFAPRRPPRPARGSSAACCARTWHTSTRRGHTGGCSRASSSIL
jgi:hypothetical protein